MIAQIQNKTFKFKSSYNDFNLIDIKKWVNNWAGIDILKKELDGLIGQYDGLKELVDLGMSAQAEDEERVISSELDFVRMELSELMKGLLEVACPDKNLKKMLHNTEGINYPYLRDKVNEINAIYGDFVEYFNNCPLVESFYHKGQNAWIGRTYKVHDMSRNTVLRDALATVETSIAFNYKLEVSQGAWDNICKFVALVARPIKQEHEIAFEKKSFINAKEVAGLSNSDKLTLYQKKLNESVEKRYKLFENLPLPVAIGVLRMYEKKKMMLG